MSLFLRNQFIQPSPHLPTSQSHEWTFSTIDTIHTHNIHAYISHLLAWKWNCPFILIIYFSNEIMEIMGFLTKLSYFQEKYIKVTVSMKQNCIWKTTANPRLLPRWKVISNHSSENFNELRQGKGDAVSRRCMWPGPCPIDSILYDSHWLLHYWTHLPICNPNVRIRLNPINRCSKFAVLDSVLLSCELDSAWHPCSTKSISVKDIPSPKTTLWLHHLSKSRY
jgi:hypothetical protein